MKKHLSLITLLLTLCMNVTALWADEVTYSPVLDVNFRTAANNTSWQVVNNAADEGKQDFELTYTAGFFSLQKYTVADLNNATKLVLTLTVGGRSGVDAVKVWAFTNNDWTAASGVDDIVPLVEAQTGIAPRATEGTVNSPMVNGAKVANSNPAKATFTITGTALATIKANASSDGTFTLLLTNNDLLNTNNKRSYLSANSANAEANRPSLVATIEQPALTLNNVGYETLAEAIAAVSDGGEGVITVHKDITISSRVNVQSKNITIKGATGSEKISRATNYTNGLCFLTLAPGSGYTTKLTLEDVVIDGAGVDATAALFEAANYGTTTLKNVTIQNAKNTNTGSAQAIIVNKVGGSLVLNGVTFTSCSVPDGHGFVFVGTNNVTLSGNNAISDICIEKALTITATNATHTTPINLILENTRAAGTVVKGGTVSKYTTSGGPDGYVLTQNGSDVDLSAPAAPNVVIEETNTNYATLADALNAVEDGATATLIINVPQELSARVNIKNKNITLKGGTDGTIKRAAGNTGNLLFLTVAPDAGYTSELTLDDVTIDGQNIEATAPVMEAANYGKTTLNNVTFLNCKDTKESSLDCSMISNKTGGTLVLNGVTMTGCSVPEGKGLIFVGTANVTLKGANTIASMYVENKYLLKVDDAATATSPITLLTDNGRAYGQITEGGNADIFTSSNYRMSQQMDGVYLMPAAVTKSYTHPGLLHTAADIARVKANLTLEPFKSAYAQLETTSGGTAAGAVEILKRMDQSNWSATYPDYGNFSRAATDAKLAYQLALRYQLKGSTAAATAAVNILNDWATHCKGVLRLKGYNNNIPDPNEYLLTIQAYQFANAAELLRSYNGWQTADFTKFQNWMRETYADLAVQFLENHHGNDNPLHYWLNWDLAALTAIYSVGVLCDDKTLVDYALNYTTNGEGNGNVMYANVATADDPDSNETLAQCQESGRDQGHATLDVTLLGALCQMAQNQGTDLFTPYKALEMAEYVAKYNLKNDAGEFAYTAADLPFTAYNNGEVNHTAISDEARGTLRPAWELFLAYAQNNGKEAHYCQQWSEWARRQNAYGEASTSSNDDLGYGTLMYMSADADDYSYTLAVGNAGAATLVLPFDATIPEDVKAYTLTVNGNSAVCTEVETTIPANTPVLVMADKGSYTFEGTSIWKSGTPTVGALTGVFSKTIVPATCYILTLADNQLAFRQADGATNTVEANRAYLSTGSANVKLLRVDFGSVDAIDATKTDQTDATLYDLSGRKMVKGNLPNGLYITGGKVIVKAK